MEGTEGQYWEKGGEAMGTKLRNCIMVKTIRLERQPVISKLPAG